MLIALREHGGNSIRGLSARTGLKRSTVHRMLLALESRLFVVQEPETGRYRLGPRLVDLGHAASHRGSASLELLAEVQRLAHATRETAQLAVLSARGVLFQECLECAPGLHVSMPRGSHLPPHRSAFGKALLARLPIDAALILLEALPSKEEREELLAELATIRRAGVAHDRDVAAPGSFAIASPILDYTGRGVASIGIHAPSSRFADEAQSRIEATVRTSAESASVRLGYFASSEIWQRLSAASRKCAPSVVQDRKRPHTQTRRLQPWVLLAAHRPSDWRPLQAGGPRALPLPPEPRSWPLLYPNPRKLWPPRGPSVAQGEPSSRR